MEQKMFPVPRIQREDQVLVEVEAVSICGTDVHITAGALLPGCKLYREPFLGMSLLGK